MTDLKPCPACGAPAHHGMDYFDDTPNGYVECSSKSCSLEGPVDDPDGAKWNALPRNPTDTSGVCEDEFECARVRRMLDKDDKWISVEERLPTAGDDVAVTDGTYVSYGWWSDTWDSWVDCPELGDEPTHWQPLPEPPK